MGDIKSTVSKAEIESETPKNDEDDSQNTNNLAKILQSGANDLQIDIAADISESFNSTLSVPKKNLLRVCKPLSVKLIRLPDKVIKKFTQADLNRKNKRKKKMWKVGIYFKDRNKKFIQQQRLFRERNTLLKWLQSSTKEKSENVVEKLKQEKNFIGEISKISESTKIEESPSEKFVLPGESIAPKENAIDKSAECTENIETTAQILTQSELSGSESQIASKTCEIFPNKPDQRSFLEISDNIEIRSATPIPQDLLNVAVDTTEILPESSPVVSSEANKNQNREINLERLFEQNNPLTTQSVTMRKRILESDDETNSKQNHSSKKYKSSKLPDSSKEMDTTHEKNDRELIKSSVPIVKEVTIHKCNQANPISIRRRSIKTEKIISKEVKVVLCRLEDSHDKLVFEWIRKNPLVRSNDVISSESRTSSAKYRAAAKESSEIGELIAGVPITSVKDLSGSSDVNKRLNGLDESDSNVLTKEYTSASIIAATSGETGESQDEDDDDEIVQFFRRRNKVRPSIDSSRSASSSSSQTFVSTRVLRSRASKMNASFFEKIVDFPVAKKASRLRIRESSTSTDSSNVETINDHRGIPQLLGEQPTNTSVLSKTRTRTSPTIPTSESSDAEHLSVSLLNEKTVVFAANNNSTSQENIPMVEENEVRITNETNNNDMCRTPNFIICRQNQSDDVSIDPLAEINYHPSEIQNGSAENCDEVLAARRKLTALKNAMVVLTRLEELDGLTEEIEYSVDDVQFKTTQEFGLSRNSTPDPLAINTNDNQHPLRETENSIVPSLTSSLRVSPRKTLRSDDVAYFQNIEESPESDVEMHLGLEDTCSQETIESDVEMTLVLEENSSQDEEKSDGESPRSEEANRTRLASKDNDESPIIATLDGGKAAKSHDDKPTDSFESSSLKSSGNLPDGILTDARSNSGDSRKIPNENEGLDEHCKRCSCEEHKNDKHRLNCQNIPGLYKCVTCRIIFKDTASLEAHKSTSAVCNSGFICNICQTTYSTLNALTSHRVSCVNKVSQKQSSVDDPTNVEENTEVENPPASNADSLAIKVNQKNETYKKVLSRKLRAKNRFPIDNLKCGVCSITFGTTQALSEHIFKHNMVELQQAYKNAKARALEDSKASKATLAKNKQNPSTEEIISKIVTAESPKDLCLPQQPNIETTTPIADTVMNKDVNAKTAIVCLCHRDKHPACPEKTDLQIEMVLFCQYCSVIFRRRECFETHYRTNPGCATDRTRGRSPKLYCANCQSTLNSWAGMRRHLEVHASLNVEGTVRFVCNICRVIFVGFGALFYNHWTSHLKDTMFVASRYSFPKNSVQPIDGMPKLPIGATSDESYILVAEHVCSNCKKPFSTRRDLEIHVKSKICEETDEAVASENQWNCDFCNLSFTSRRDLNKHSQAQHAQRFLCIATSPLTLNFMCTRCFVIKKLVADIEEHWKTALQHDSLLACVENVASVQNTPATSDAVNTANGSMNENQIERKTASNDFVDETKVIDSGEKSKNKDIEPLIDISENNEPEITCVFQSSVKTAGNEVACVNIQESQSTLINSEGSSTIAANDSSMPENVLSSSTTVVNNERAKTRALEDPFVDIVVSDVTSTNVSAQLVINENQTHFTNDINSRTNVDSYKIVITPEAFPVNVEIEKNLTKTIETAKEANNENSIVNTSDMMIVTANKPNQSKKQESHIEIDSNSDVSTKTPDSVIGNENKKLSEIGATNKPDSAAFSWLKQRLTEVRSARAKRKLASAKSSVPEVIDLSDEDDEVEAVTASTPGEKSKPTSVITKNNVYTVTDNKSKSSRSKKSASKSKSLAQVSSSNDSGASNQDSFPFVLDTAEKSFEEIRFADYTRSKESRASDDSAGAKKPGFLRVKNLSELQAVKNYNCSNCNVVFETPNALEDHYRSRLCASLEKPPVYPEAMTGALILPDNSNVMATQPIPTVCAAETLVTQQLIGLDSRLGVISGVPISNVIVNNETTGSWINVEGQHDNISTVALVNTAHSFTGGTLLMNLGGQQTTNDNSNTLMATSIATSTESVAQTQDIIALQQKQQQQQGQYQQQQQQCRQLQQQNQYQQQQPQCQQQQQQCQQLQQQNQYQQQQQQCQQLQQQRCQQLQQQNQYQQQLQQQLQFQPQQQVHYQQQQPQYQQQALLSINQQVGENCNGQLGFHIMPAMVLPQTTQINKQQCTNGTLGNTSMANLPINGQINNASFTDHSNKPNRYLCSICSTYSCNSIGTMNVHVMKHYTGFNNPTNQNSTQSTAGGISNVGVQSAKEKNRRNSVENSVFLKNTPQGLVWVTSVSTQVPNQQPGSSAGQDNSQINSDDSVVRGGQVIYRCLICKCAMYKTYPPLRNHIVLVHGIRDLVSAGLDNIVQKVYLCTHCPHGTAMYDSEESHRQHVDSCHSIVCLNCGRAFATNNNLKMHMTTCSEANRNTNNASDKNC